MINFFAIFLVLIATLISALGSLYFKIGSEKLSRKNLKNLMKNYGLIKGVILYGISSVFYITALKFGELSFIYPLVSLSYIWVSLLSIKFLNEKMNFWKWSGVFLIITGVSFIGLGSV